MEGLQCFINGEGHHIGTATCMRVQSFLTKGVIPAWVSPGDSQSEWVNRGSIVGHSFVNTLIF